MPNLKENLLIHLPLDETLGENAKDVSGNGNDGTLNNLTFQDDGVAGKIGRALSRSAGGENVNCGALGLGDADQLISFWFKTTETSGNVYAVSARDGAAGGLSVLMSPGANVGITPFIGSSSNGTTQFIGGNDGEWHHVVVAYDQAPDDTLFMWFDNSHSLTDNTLVGTWDDSKDTQLFERVGQELALNLTLDDVRIYTGLQGVGATDPNGFVQALFDYSGEADTFGDIAHDIAGDIASDIVS